MDQRGDGGLAKRCASHTTSEEWIATSCEQSDDFRERDVPDCTKLKSAKCQKTISPFRQKLKDLIDRSSWAYAAFWVPNDDEGELVWKDGYYNGPPPAGLDAVIYKEKFDEIRMQQRSLVEEIQGKLGNSEEPDDLQPDDLQDTAWFYIMAMTSKLTKESGACYPGPAHTWATGEHDWIAVDGKPGDARVQMAVSAGVQTIVCVAVQGGILEIGTTQMVPEDLSMVGLFRAVFNGEKAVHYLSAANDRLFAPATSLHASAVFAAAIAAAVAAHDEKRSSSDVSCSSSFTGSNRHWDGILKTTPCLEGNSQATSCLENVTSPSVPAASTALIVSGSGLLTRQPRSSDSDLQPVADDMSLAPIVTSKNRGLTSGAMEEPSSLTSLEKDDSQQGSHVSFIAYQELCSEANNCTAGSKWWELLLPDTADYVLLDDSSDMDPTMAGHVALGDATGHADVHFDPEPSLDGLDGWTGMTVAGEADCSGKEKDLRKDLPVGINDLELPDAEGLLESQIRTSLSNPLKELSWNDDSFLTSLGDDDTYAMLAAPATPSNERDKEWCTNNLREGPDPNLNFELAATGPSSAGGVSDSAKAHSNKLVQPSLAFRTVSGSNLFVPSGRDITANSSTDMNTTTTTIKDNDASFRKRSSNNRDTSHSDGRQAGKDDYKLNGWISHNTQPHMHHHGYKNVPRSDAPVCDAEWSRNSASVGMEYERHQHSILMTKDVENDGVVGCTCHARNDGSPLERNGAIDIVTASVEMGQTTQSFDKRLSNGGHGVVTSYSQLLETGNGDMQGPVGEGRPREMPDGKEPMAKRLRRDMLLSFPVPENCDGGGMRNGICGSSMPIPFLEKTQQDQQFLEPILTSDVCGNILTPSMAAPTTPLYMQSSFHPGHSAVDRYSLLRDAVPTSSPSLTAVTSMSQEEQVLPPPNNSVSMQSMAGTMRALTEATTSIPKLDACPGFQSLTSAASDAERLGCNNARLMVENGTFRMATGAASESSQMRHHLNREDNCCWTSTQIPSSVQSLSFVTDGSFLADGSGEETDHLNELMNGTRPAPSKWDERESSIGGGVVEAGQRVQRLGQRSAGGPEGATLGSCPDLSLTEFIFDPPYNDCSSSLWESKICNFDGGYANHPWTINRSSVITNSCPDGLTGPSTTTPQLQVSIPAPMLTKTAAPQQSVHSLPRKESTRSCTMATKMREHHRQHSRMSDARATNDETKEDQWLLQWPSEILAQDHFNLAQCMAPQTEAPARVATLTNGQGTDKMAATARSQMENVFQRRNPIAGNRSAAHTMDTPSSTVEICFNDSFGLQGTLSAFGLNHNNDVFGNRTMFDGLLHKRADTLPMAAGNQDWHAASKVRGMDKAVQNKRKQQRAAALARAILTTRSNMQSLPISSFSNFWGVSPEEIPLTT